MKEIIFVCILVFVSTHLYSYEETIMDYYQGVTKASSELKVNSSNNFYAAWKVLDGDSATAWVEGKNENGIDEYICINIGQISDKIRAIEILPGVAKNNNIYVMNNRPKDIAVVLFDEYTDSKTNRLIYKEFITYNYTLKDEMVFQRYDLIGVDQFYEKVRENLKLKIVIKSVYLGTRFRDTAISEVKLIDENEKDVCAQVRKIFNKKRK